MLAALLKLFPDRIICGLATLGPVGYWGKAPGTVGSVCGVVFYTVCFHPLQGNWLLYGALLFLFAWLSVLICDEAERRLQRKDPGFVILDEFVAMPICFLGTQYYGGDNGLWLVLLVGFVVFRFFDILKPLGIKKLQNYPGGQGVVYDDLAAAGATCVVLHVLFGWLPVWMGA